MADRVLVTGGAGFIGSHLVDLLLERGFRVIVLDRLSRGGSLANLESHARDPRLRFVRGDADDDGLVGRLVTEADAVVHAAAESHVDRSIDAPRAFLEANVLATQTVLEACRAHARPMLMVSTDEVYGPGAPGGGRFDEWSPIRPRNPYAASKAAADLLCQAYHATYGTPVTILRGTNAYGPRQIEKAVPTYAVAALKGRPVPVYGRGEQRREWLHVRDWVRAALLVLERGEPGQVYNVGGGEEISNLELARRICALAGAPKDLVAFVPDRPGHDLRYGLSWERLRALGWRPEVPLERGLAETVAWYRDHLDWLRAAHGTNLV